MNYSRLLICFSIIMCTSNDLHAQTPSHQARFTNAHITILSSMTNLERYGKDYEVLNYDFHGDSTILDQIDLAYLEKYRLQNGKNKAYDENTGLTIVLYSIASLQAQVTDPNVPIKTEEE